MLGWIKNKLSAAPGHVPQREARSPATPGPGNQERANQLLAQGNAMLDAGRMHEAATLYRAACAAQPDNAQAHVNLGFALLEQSLPDEAQTSLAQAVALDPWLHDAHYLLGTLEKGRGNLTAAIVHMRSALAVKPAFPECRRDLCIALAQTGETAEAARVLEAGEAFPAGSQDLYFFRGNLHLVENRFEEAIREFGNAVAADPGNPAALTNLGLAQFKHGDVFAAIDTYGKLLTFEPGNVTAHCNLGGAWQVRGRLDMAAKSYADAMRLDPDYIAAQHNRLYALSFDAACSPQEYLREARATGAWMSAHAKPYSQWLCPPAANRPLRIGLVSGDLRNHPVGAFLEGVVSSIDRSRLALVAYSSRKRGDQLTERIKPFFARWNQVEELADEALAAKIHADRIDILVDLAGHTAYNRLPVFAWRPAPVQVAWLGFFATTGVAEMDYILVDPVAVPEEGREFLGETPWNLPDTRLCFTPPVTGRPLPVDSLPALRNGCVTFGSFQIFSKLSDQTLAAWAKVLHAVPRSRLRLQSWQLGFERARADVIERLGAHGIDAARIAMHGGSPRDDYLAAHGEVDIILDTFPFPGGTTTAEALWMGVPTVTLTGRTLLERQGESLLRCAGLADWVASDEVQFVALAAAKAGDLAALARLRVCLREQVLASPLFDAPRFARNLEAAFAGMWAARGELSARQGA